MGKLDSISHGQEAPRGDAMGLGWMTAHTVGCLAAKEQA